MLRIFTDFNAMTPDDECWILVYQGKDIEDIASDLNLAKGQRVILYQDDDFDVTANLDFRYVEFLQRNCWVAMPDWDTIVYR